MDPVDEFAKLRAEIQVLEGRAAVLRDSFLRPGVRLRSNGFEGGRAHPAVAAVPEIALSAKSLE